MATTTFSGPVVSTNGFSSPTGALNGFFGATPVAQPTTAVSAAAFVANTSGISDDTATYGGYTMGQVVAALKALGLLA